jgi:flagellar basal-body rod protein FlgF
MDRLVYVAMSGAKETLRAQAANNHNLANANTNGFKADLMAFQTQSVVGAGLPSRAYATNDSSGWDASSGSLDATGRDLDVAVQGSGWIAVQASDGTEAYTRAGDLHVDAQGNLLTATGANVLSDNGPITVPQFQSINVGTDGSVSIVPLGQTAQTVSTIGRIKLVNPTSDQLQRGADGLFRSTNGQEIDSDASVHLASGMLESSNVNIAETMANMIELARNYEVQVKAMKTAEDTAAESTKLLQSS